MGEYTYKSAKKGHCVAIIALVMLVGAKESRANLVPISASYLGQEGIEYYIQTNKAVYDVGEDVEMLFRVTNMRDEDVRIYGGWPMRDIIVEEKEGNNLRVLWQWWWFKIGPGMPVGIDLEPGESSKISGSWPQTDWNETPEIEDDFQVLPGTYRVSGILKGRIGDFENFEYLDSRISLDITIVPEPATIFTLVFGIYGLRHLKRKRIS